MPISLRARPTCHYCGKRNSPSNSPRKFTCQYCQAENYLDESGQITDVPSSTAATPRQFAVPLTPAFENTEGSIFCSTCLKNQYMYNTALAEYLPDPDHPEYDRFEAAIPAFKKDLERRFPTCCANCEPKVKAQLQQATYNARSDHVRRVLDRSRQRKNASRWGWRSLLVNAAGLGWLSSLLLQLMWHALGSQTNSKFMMSNIQPTECLMTWPIPVECPALTQHLVGPALLLGVLCVWWNPKWQHKLEGREGRLIGLDKFYKVQGVLLALRFVLWTIITDVPNIANYRSMIHTISLVLITMIAGWSSVSIIRIYTPRIVDWSQDPAPLLDSQQFVPPASTQVISPPNSQDSVPVGIFNTSAYGGLQPWRPPTPPVDEDAMEWDPTPATFSPNLKKLKYRSAEPTPFQGTLQAFNRGGVYQTRQETTVEQPKAIGLPPGFFDKSHGRSISDNAPVQSNDAGLAQPKFFPDIGRADTGLENIFDKVFSLQEEPDSSQKDLTISSNGKVTGKLEHHSQISGLQSTPGALANMSKVYNGVTGLSLAAFVMLFSAQCYLDLPLLPGISTMRMLEILVAVPLLDVMVFVTSDSPNYSFKLVPTKAAISLFESAVLLALRVTRPEPQSVLVTPWNKLVIASLAVLCIQHIYHFWIGIISTQHESAAASAEYRVQKPVTPVMMQLESEPRYQSAATEFQPLRRSSSDESLASTASIATTSTASGWKTPVKNHREELRSGSSSTSYGLGGLSLKNDHTFGVGSGIAGTRNRRAPPRGGQQGW